MSKIINKFGTLVSMALALSDIRSELSFRDDLRFSNIGRYNASPTGIRKGSGGGSLTKRQKLLGIRRIKPKEGPNIKVGRNEPCTCGSGLKYKKCCLNKKES